MGSNEKHTRKIRCGDHVRRTSKRWLLSSDVEVGLTQQHLVQAGRGRGWLRSRHLPHLSGRILNTEQDWHSPHPLIEHITSGCVLKRIWYWPNSFPYVLPGSTCPWPPNSLSSTPAEDSRKIKQEKHCSRYPSTRQLARYHDTLTRLHIIFFINTTEWGPPTKTTIPRHRHLLPQYRFENTALTPKPSIPKVRCYK